MTAHSKPLETVLQELETDWSHGLGPEQVAARFARYGPNRLRQAKKKTNIQRFFDLRPHVYTTVLKTWFFFVNQPCMRCEFIYCNFQR